MENFPPREVTETTDNTADNTVKSPSFEPLLHFFADRLTGFGPNKVQAGHFRSLPTSVSKGTLKKHIKRHSTGVSTFDLEGKALGDHFKEGVEMFFVSGVDF